MLFQTPEYAVLLALTLALYFHLRHRAQNVLLLAASLVFYGWWDYRFLGLLIVSAGIDYVAGLRMRDARGAVDAHRAKAWLIVSMASNLTILGFFKYFNFFVGSAAGVLSAVGFDPHLPTLNVVLPVGISFYTFQSMSYTIDVYRGELEPTPDPIDFFLFVSFFPQLVAGPIERATALLPQVQRPRIVTDAHIREGATWFLIGLARKVLIADPAGVLADQYFRNPGGYATIPLACGLVLYALQIYNDFAGYSDMARGSASLLGFRLMRNFQHPYFAADISDFWRRWHISLSTWLRDYLYIPLGGNRKGQRRTQLNLVTTMLLGGLWHGASWNFVIWGGLHGAYLSIHHALRRRGRDLTDFMMPGAPSWARRIGGSIGLFTLVTFTWLFFRAHDLPTTLAYLRGLASLQPGYEGSLLPVLVLAAMTCAIDVPQAVADTELVPLGWPVGVRVGLATATMVLLMFSGNLQHVPFIYFQF